MRFVTADAYPSEQWRLEGKQARRQMSSASISYSRRSGAAQARFFFFDLADLAVDLLARAFGKGIEEFLEAFGLTEFAGPKPRRHFQASIP
jgi:hypothetical protein